MKPKRNSAAQSGASYDRCQTPGYALDPILPFLSGRHVWEPAAGDGYLAAAMRSAGLAVTATDLLTGQDFFACEIPAGVECVITNPPYSIKYRWMERCCEIGVPFALLVPLEMLGAARAQRAIAQCGVELVFMDKRVDFKMPDHTWQESSAQFPVIWLTHGLGIGQAMTFVRLHKYSAQRLAEMDAGVSQEALF